MLSDWLLSISPKASCGMLGLRLLVDFLLPSCYYMTIEEYEMTLEEYVLILLHDNGGIWKSKSINLIIVYETWMKQIDFQTFISELYNSTGMFLHESAQSNVNWVEESDRQYPHRFFVWKILALIHIHAKLFCNGGVCSAHNKLSPRPPKSQEFLAPYSFKKFSMG